MMARAVNLAVSGRPGPVFLAVPQDDGEELTGSAPRGRPRLAAPHPDPVAAAAVLDALLAARRPVIVAGGGLYYSATALGGLQ
jgi:acetolactate synthase-1/2/3 large subunit